MSTLSRKRIEELLSVSQLVGKFDGSYLHEEDIYWYKCLVNIDFQSVKAAEPAVVKWPVECVQKARVGWKEGGGKLATGEKQGSASGSFLKFHLQDGTYGFYFKPIQVTISTPKSEKRIWSMADIMSETISHPIPSNGLTFKGKFKKTRGNAIIEASWSMDAIFNGCPTWIEKHLDRLAARVKANEALLEKVRTILTQDEMMAVGNALGALGGAIASGNIALIIGTSIMVYWHGVKYAFEQIGDQSEYDAATRDLGQILEYLEKIAKHYPACVSGKPGVG